MQFEILLSHEAVDDLKHLGAPMRARVVEALETYLRHEPRKVSKSRIKRLRGLSKPQFRLRVDDVRVFYDVSEDTVEVVAILAKDSAEEWLRRVGEVS